MILDDTKDNIDFQFIYNVNEMYKIDTNKRCIDKFSLNAVKETIIISPCIIFFLLIFLFRWSICIISPCIMLYNILLAINRYVGTITKNVIAKSINRLGIPHGYFSALLDISIPHEYADVSY